MMVTLTINGRAVEVQEHTTILEASREVEVRIPTLCYNSYLKPYGGCRMCLVEIENQNTGLGATLVSACTYPVEEGLVVNTESDRVVEGRRFILELLYARCPESPEIEALAREYGVSKDDSAPLDTVGTYLLFRASKPDHTKCILCGQCVRVCAEIVQRTALSLSNRGSSKKVATPFNRISEACIGCGSCAYLCPTNAITVEEET